MRILKYITTGFAIALGIFLSLETAFGEEKPHYVPGEILVKFKGEVVATLQSGTVQTGKALGDIKLTTSLDKLNNKYIKNITQVFPNYRKDRQRTEKLKSKDTSLLTPNEKHILKRLTRAPRDAKTPDLDRIYKLKLSEGKTVEETVAEYAEDPNVEYAEPNYIVSVCLTPNDPLYSVQWPLNNIGQDYPASGDFNIPPGTPDSDIDTPEAWDITETIEKTEVIVAVVDTGADYNHRDLDDSMWVNQDEVSGDGNNDGFPGIGGTDDDGDGLIDEDSLGNSRFLEDGITPNPNWINDIPDDDDENGYIDDIYGYDFCTYYHQSDPDPFDDHGHGTHCSGIIAAEGDNGFDIAGVSWDSKVMALKILNNNGEGLIDDAVTAFYYAVENGADVTSNSWGGGEYSQTVQDVINYAYSQGVVMVAAAGNNNCDSPQFPAAYENMIAVIATDSNDNKATFSNFGNWTEVAAPGVDVLSLIPDNRTGVMSGTSMACPHVSGLAALILSIAPTVTNEDVRQIMRDSADDLGEPGYDIYYGFGRINAHEAVLITPSPYGRIGFDSILYTAPSQPVITVTDTDLNVDSEIAETVAVEVHGTTEMVPEEIILTEIGPNKGIFRGSISIEPFEPDDVLIPLDGILKVQHGDTLTAEYEELSPAGTREATAQIDLQIPVINSVEANPNDIPIGSSLGAVTITWNTDELSNSTVYYGIEGTDPSTFMSATSASYVTSHAVTVTAMELDTPYKFYVVSQDIAGNAATNNNGGSYYDFIVISPIIAVSPSALIIEAWEKEDPFVEIISITNVGRLGAENVDLLFEIPEPAQRWLSVSPSAGRIPVTESMEVQLTFYPQLLESPGDYAGAIIINNNTPTENPVNIQVHFKLNARQIVDYLRYNIIDYAYDGQLCSNNNDRQFNPGEEIELEIEVRNMGSLPVFGASAELSLATADPYVTIIDDEITLGEIAPHTTILSSDDFIISSERDTPDNHTVVFSLDITDSGGNLWHEEFPITIIEPVTGPADDTIILNVDMPGSAGLGDPRITCDDNGNVYAVWVDDRDGEGDIYFNYSVDFGATWQEHSIRIDTDEPGTGDSLNPQISCDDNGHAYAAWYDKRDGNHNICFNYSEDYGATWLPRDVTIHTTLSGEIPSWYTAPSWFPHIASDNNGYVYVAWTTDATADALFSLAGFNCSSDYGFTWQSVSADLKFERISCDDYGHVYATYHFGEFYYSLDHGATWAFFQKENAEPVAGTYLRGDAINCDGNGNVYIAWVKETPPPPHGDLPYRDIYFNASGEYLPPLENDDFQISKDRQEQDVQMDCNENGYVYAVWRHENYSPYSYDLRFNRSSDYGSTWEGETILGLNGYNHLITSNDYGNVFVSCDEGLIYSTDYGVTWENPIGISDPRISCDNKGYAYIVWCSSGDGEENNVYFTRLVLGEEPDVLVVDDYDDANEDENRLGLGTGWEASGSSTAEQVDLEPMDGDKLLKLNYDCSQEGDYLLYTSSLWGGIGYLDFSNFEYLSFRVKGEEGGEDFYIGLQFRKSRLWLLADGDILNAGSSSTPALCDIDADGDNDMFIGNYDGTIVFYRNDGTPQSAAWTLVSTSYNGIDVGMNSAPAFCDIDADGDYDMFIGEYAKDLNFYRNDGTPQSPVWTLAGSSYAGVSEYYSVPAFCDIDADGDYDMFIGYGFGRIAFYRNDGTPQSPNWVLVTRFYNNISVGGNSAPALYDIDGDGDYDMFIGNNNGSIFYYRNDGTPQSPQWILVDNAYNNTDVGMNSTPTFCDIDGDGDNDMFIGESDGRIAFYWNISSGLYEDSVFYGDSVEIHSSDYFTVTDEWQQVNVPLTVFPDLDTAMLHSFSIVLNNSLAVKNGIVYLDNLLFAKIPIKPSLRLNPIGNRAAQEGEELSFTVTAVNRDGADLTFIHPKSNELPQCATFTDYGNGCGIFNWAPRHNQSGDYVILFEVSDGEFSASEEVTIHVDNVLVPPPTVSLSVNPMTVAAGQSFTVTVSGESPVGLASVWWWVEDQDEPGWHEIPGTVDGVSRNLAPAQDFGQGYGMTSHTYTRTVTINEPGNYLIKANSRDILYPIPGEPHQASEGEGIAIVPVMVYPDNEAPVITNIMPQDGSTTKNKKQPFHATMSDNVLLKSCMLYLDGENVLSSICPMNVQTADIGWTPGEDLSYGEHTYELRVWDIDENMSVAITTFTVRPSGCFLEGTPILMKDSTTKPIEEMKVGDEILSFDEETKSFNADTVKHLFTIPGEEEYLVINGHLKVTPSHCFYIEGKWLEAGELKVGDNLLTKDGKDQTITSIEKVKDTVTVYNLDIATNDTFIADNIVVHNAELKGTLKLKDNIAVPILEKRKIRAQDAYKDAARH